MGITTGLPGCSILSPVPAFELAKAMGTTASVAVQLGPGQATDTVVHPHRRASFWCIELNRESQALDLVPALQNELQAQGVESRLYEAGNTPTDCPAVLQYNAYLRWDQPLWSNEYQSYLYAATLTLRGNGGEVLATSRYEIDLLGTSKWAGTRKKIAPVVKALLTGFNG
jgi:hypothetical protein